MNNYLHIAALVAVFIMASILFSFARAIVGKYAVHPFDMVSLIFSACVTFLLFYYHII